MLGLRDEHGRPLVDTLAEQLRDLDVLLVLDNCEQVLDGTARLVERLLHLAPKLRVLATSREPLGVEGEVTWRVPSLDNHTGCALFADRAAQARPGFNPDAAEQGVIAEIVSRLDGIPLAIELAAARVRMMRPSRILAALDDRFRLLTGGSRTMMPRQQTLEASVAWSYDLLDEAEQTLARRLSILHGFTLETAEAVGSDDAIDEYAVLELLTRLVDKSLVHVVETGADTRYRMLETVRQFLHGHLIAEGEAEPVRRRQLTHFLGVAELLAPALAFADGPNHLARLQADHDNLEDALEWAASTGSGESMLRLATALTLFWELRGHLVSGGRWFLRALGADDAEVSVIRARALWGAAHVAFYGGDYETALQRAGQSLAMAETVGDDWAAARALNTVGVMQALDSPVAARESLERSVEFGESIGDRWAVADGWKMLTVAWHVQHDAVGIRAPLDQLRRTGEQLGSPFFLAWYEVMVGYFARDRGDYATARTAFERSLEYCRAFGEPSTAGFAEVWLAALDADEGALEAASQHLSEFLARAAASGGELAILEGAFALGQIALSIGDTAGARAIAEPSIAAGREAGVPGWVSQALIVLAAARRADGDTEGATAALDEAAELVTHLENVSLDALIAYERARVARRRGDDAAAEDLLHAALALQIRGELRPGVVLTLEALAALVLDGDSPAEAVRCLGAADTLRRDIGLGQRPIDEADHAACMTRCREQLGDADFESNWAAAAALPLSEIMEYVARARGARKRPSSGWASLTPTELRVVALVTKGLTNPQIAERMFIARGTAKVHVGHIFEKLGVTSRSQLASEATARQVTDPT